MHKITETWEVNSVTWENQPAFPYNALDENSNTSIAVWEDYDVTSAVKEMVADGSKNYGFMVKFPYEEDYKGARIRSSEASEQSERPKLTVTYDPDTDIDYFTTPAKSQQFQIRKIAGSLFLSVPFPGTYTASISDLKGRKLTSFTADENKLWYQIPASLSPGMHIISIRTTEKMVAEKFWLLQ